MLRTRDQTPIDHEVIVILAQLSTPSTAGVSDRSGQRVTPHLASELVPETKWFPRQVFEPENLPAHRFSYAAQPQSYGHGRHEPCLGRVEELPDGPPGHECAPP